MSCAVMILCPRLHPKQWTLVRADCELSPIISSSVKTLSFLASTCATMAADRALFTLPPIYILFMHLFLLPLIQSHSLHDLLKSRGLPAGLFPENVKSYDLDQDGHLQVYLDRPCLAKFETRVFFDSVVRANLSYGGLTGVEGLSQEELFLWLPVKDIIVYDPSSGLILFDIGVAHKQLSLSLFEDPPACKTQGFLSEGGRKELGFQVQR